MPSSKDAIHTLKAAVRRVAEDYDYILIVPASAQSARSTRCARPTSADPDAVPLLRPRALSDLVQTLRKMQQHLNPTLENRGACCAPSRPAHDAIAAVAAQLEQHFGNKLFKAVIPRNVRLAEAHRRTGTGTLLLDKDQQGARRPICSSPRRTRRTTQAGAA